MSSLTPYIILGTGPLGLAIMDKLVADGLPVHLVNRSGRLNEQLRANVTIEGADVTNPDMVANICAAATYVFWCAQPAYHRWPEEFPVMTKAIIDGVSRTDAKLIFGSNTYMYGDPAGTPLTEASPINPHTRKGKVRAEMADMLLTAHNTGRLPVVIGRASDFYGPRVKASAMGELVFAAAIEGKTVNLVGDLDAPHSYTYIRDFAKALVTLAHDEAAYGQVWHVPSAPAGTTRQFMQLVEAAVGKPIKFSVSGKIMLRLIGLFNPTVHEMVEMLYEFEQPFLVDSSKFELRYGQTATPHIESINATIVWYCHFLGSSHLDTVGTPTD